MPDPVHVGRSLGVVMTRLVRQLRTDYRLDELITGDTVLHGEHVAGRVVGVNILGAPVVRIVAGGGETAGLTNVQRMEDHPTGQPLGRPRPASRRIGRLRAHNPGPMLACLGLTSLAAGRRAVEWAAQAEQAKLTKEALVDQVVRGGYSYVDAVAQVERMLAGLPLA